MIDEMKKEPVQEEMSLEEAFEALEELTRRLESREITLEESFSCYRKGMELLKLCHSRLDTVQKKMLLLNEDGSFEEF